MGCRLPGRTLEEGGGGGEGVGRKKQSSVELLPVQTIGSDFGKKKMDYHIAMMKKLITYAAPAGATVCEGGFIKHGQVITRSPPSGFSENYSETSLHPSA